MYYRPCITSIVLQALYYKPCISSLVLQAFITNLVIQALYYKPCITSLLFNTRDSQGLQYFVKSKVCQNQSKSSLSWDKYKRSCRRPEVGTPATGHCLMAGLPALPTPIYSEHCTNLYIQGAQWSRIYIHKHTCTHVQCTLYTDHIIHI